MGIEERLYNELFITKNVNLHSDEYYKLYHQIWLCEEYFKDFLLASDSSLKLDYAKKIYNYMQAFNDVVIPNDFINSIIYNQQHMLSESTETYVPQDHVIHCINLYILGNYLFFNFPAFHDQLLVPPQPNLTLQQRIIKFINKWKYFALYHDIGYSIEAIVDKSGRIVNQSNCTKMFSQNFVDKLIYHYTIRSISRLIASTALFERKAEPFDISSFISKCSFSWVKNDKEINSTELIKELSNFKNASIIQAHISENEIMNYAPLLKSDSYMIIKYDANEIPFSLHIKKENKVISSYFRLGASKHESVSRSQYIIKDIGKVINQCDIHNPTYVKHYFNHLPKSFQSEFDILFANNIDRYIFQLYEWFRKKTKGTISGDFEKQHQENLINYYQEAISNFFSSKYHLDSSAIKTCDFNLEEQLMSIINELNQVKYSPDIKKEISEIAEKNYERDNGVYYEIMQHCNRIYKQMFSQLNSIQANKLDFLRITGKKVILNIFNHESDDKTASFLYNRIRNKCESLKISFDNIQTYRTKYTTCDHGMISAAIMFQSVILSSRLMKSSENIPELLLAWKSIDHSYSFGNDNLEDYADTIFSILLHNIYTKSNQNPNGIDYIQNFNTNSFSYFCAICDNLQKWKRPKQIEFSKSNLPNHNYMDDTYDIIISHDKLTIICDRRDAEEMKAHIKGMSTFLEGADNFITVTSI